MKKLVFLAWFFVSALLVNTGFALDLSPKNAILYSSEEIADPTERITIFQNTLELWDQLNKSEFEVTEVASPDGRFYANLKRIRETVYLKVKDTETGKSYYHFLDEMDLKKFEADPKLNFFAKLKSSSINIEDIHFQSTFDNLTDLQKVYVDKIQTLGTEAGWTEKSFQTLEDITFLYNEALTNWKETRLNSSLSDIEFADQMIKQDKVQVHVNSLGSGELNMVDDQPFIRVLHEESQLSFIFMKKGSIDRENSKHWRQYLSRQHIVAGETRLDGQMGRDVVVVELDDLEAFKLKEVLDPDLYQSFKRHKKFVSKAFWSDYWHAIAKKPTWSTGGFGLFNGAAQGIMAAGVGLLKSTIDPENAGDYLAPSKLSAVWGFGISSFVSTYKNWTNLGHKPARIAKSMLNSVMFYYILGAMANPKGIEMFNPFELQGLLAHGSVWMGAFLANLAKPHWYDLSKIREQVGISRKNFKVKLPWGKVWETKISQAAVENQLIYLIPFTLRMADFIQINIAGLPLGKFLFISSVPGAELLVLKMSVWMAKKTKHPKAIAIAKMRRKAWYKKRAYFTDSHMRKLVNRKLLAKLTFRKQKHQALSRLLAKQYPQYFTYTPKPRKPKDGEIPRATEFVVPKAGANCLNMARAFH